MIWVFLFDVLQGRKQKKNCGKKMAQKEKCKSEGGNASASHYVYMSER